ncbi:MAG: hypothetical protein PHV39_06135, partial [Methanomicrobium sp.]|nr:hypothetical protein [Methanomicrobium sp.]
TGHTFVSSGLGGMSGAQPKAANIANAVGIFAEVDLSRIETRHVRLNTTLDSGHKSESLAWEIMSVIRSRSNQVI